MRSLVLLSTVLRLVNCNMMRKRGSETTPNFMGHGLALRIIVGVLIKNWNLKGIFVLDDLSSYRAWLDDENLWYNPFVFRG